MGAKTVNRAERVKIRRWLNRLAFGLFVAIAIAVVYVTNVFLTERFTESTRNRAEVRMTLYVGNLISELQRNSIVPQLLARDPELLRALSAAEYSLSTQRLLSFVDEIGAASLMLLDKDGRTVAATDRNRLGENHRNAPYYINALRSNATIFTTVRTESGGFSFVYSRKMDDPSGTLGVMTVAVDLQKLERSWASISDAVFVADSEGTIILSTEPRWRGLVEEQALARQSPASAIDRAFEATRDWTVVPIDAYLRGEAVLRRETRVPFQGWRMVSFTTYDSVREKVNGVLALEIMGFAILLALAFWVSSRKSANRVVFFQRESAELRALNLRLQREIAERQKVEKTLEVAEQSLAQSSKLAALGEMSAAVSHELNQPLAAMKTYLAGARLLLQRKRADEALSSFGRIDDLIDRMGAITKQLKSYARKGKDAFEEVDVRDAVSTALSMMEPQLKTRKVAITRTLPSNPALIFGDRLRLEQVIINLLRNALDATKGVDDPSVEVTLTVTDAVRLIVRDNGAGIEDLDALFEPFYTTKQPGDGVGLGLAISSGIVTDLGGRLTARNGAKGGAVFEMTLPVLASDVEAAE
ncbi:MULTISPECIES: ATP-binding protein [unclassified Marivivens]|jgi:two-component system C4-dicarboxylate transport sensor histidine kinase DctB|uniref:sensor histidine kinase n=1 Tax=unclassified Marivivens TaxID=2622455 RepID=UPI0007FD14A3|nr:MULTISPECIES: ATP-binding protein [unclassified Marivivens]MCL7405961.1 ATP-binding protein [Marivivens geojensis]OBR39563.1 two-component system sensor histidine kinase [Donghicola sp. JL3646]APO86834.1 two-component system sensor histidine kinase [Marivivens sp. JLT3646]NBQ49443.1 sensor histidine kinase [Marivivens sp.]NBT51383.1 sensor histidine kinase [Marivivens sp.]